MSGVGTKANRQSSSSSFLKQKYFSRIPPVFPWRLLWTSPRRATTRRSSRWWRCAEHRLECSQKSSKKRFKSFSTFVKISVSTYSLNHLARLYRLTVLFSHELKGEVTSLMRPNYPKQIVAPPLEIFQLCEYDLKHFLRLKKSMNLDTKYDFVLERMRIFVSGKQDVRILQKLVTDHVAHSVILLKWKVKIKDNN